MKWLKAGLAVVFAGVLMLGLWLPAGRWMQTSVQHRRLAERNAIMPIIFVPGSSATQDRFDALFAALTQAGPTTRAQAHSVLKVTVSAAGKLALSGRLRAGDRQPFIVIAFADNRDGYPTIQKQAGWLATAMRDLQKRYGFTHYSGVGHSNGGLVWTLYLERKAPASLAMQHLMTLGTPFNLAESSRQNRTALLVDLLADRQKLPKTLIVDSVAGTQTMTGDGTVPLASVEAGRYVFQGQVQHFTQTTVTGADASHSDLTTNPQVVRLIQTQLLTERR
ncbi:alpha/beta hydrolase [Lacticaseibacillus daqingensis]|uniref:alpha/beta hydrolase n=1 Tax=Lacticaseibacillus daqingensis TaxID=2486014 RepID=UPI000F7A2AEA|nr:alpha/beta hydrolase [Lacticaseibacillus daqingensis]